MMRPGDRKRRWKRSSAFSFIVFVIIGTAAMFGVNGSAGIGVAMFAYLMAFLDYVDYRRGWKIRDDLPPHAYREMNHPNLIRRQIARDAAEATLREAQNPKRKRYAFD